MSTLDLELTREQLRDPLFFYSKEERNLLRRCATVRTVDEGVYDAVLQAELPQPLPTFEEMLGESYVERMPGTETGFRLRDPLRSRAYQTWWTEKEEEDVRLGDTPAGLGRFSEKLVAYYAEQNRPLDHLYHLVAVDRAAAQAEFRRRFQEADAAFDLPTCTALIHLIEDLDHLGPDLADELEEARRQLRTRTLFSRDYYETGSYLERDATKELQEQIVHGGIAGRCLHIFAPGGMGKTMFLRATVARTCVPRGIPCARIDFDYNEQNVAQERWRICLELARQLSLQLHRNPFVDLLRDNVSYLESARYARRTRRASERTASPVPADVPEKVWNLFLERLDEIDIRTVLIFDTVENLRGKEEDMLAFTEMLAALQAKNKNLQLIVAGRFNLREPLDGTPAGTKTLFDERFGDTCQLFQLSGFSHEDAHRYLVKRRHLTATCDEDEKRITAIIDKADTPRDGINPFKLAILADVVRANPEITAEEIAAYPDADLAYLIERVIERIEMKPLRWLVRYGVVPRTLTRGFVERVLLPVYREGQANPGLLDDAEKDSGVGRNAFGEQGDIQSVDALWSQLTQYTSDYSWVMSAGGDESNALVFHASVHQPMHRLLRAHLQEGRKILPLLHQRSVDYFESLAEQDQAQATRWLREALYHKAQNRDGSFDSYWFRQIDAYPDATLALAEEVLNLTTVFDDTEEDRAEEDGAETHVAAIGQEVRTVAAYRLARDLVQRQEVLSAQDQDRLQGWLGMIGTPQEGTPPVPLAGVDYIYARLSLAQDRRNAARMAITRGLSRIEQPDDAVALHLLQGDMQINDDPSAAIVSYREAYDIAQKNESPQLIDAADALTWALERPYLLEDALTVQESLTEMAIASGQNDRGIDSLVKQVHLLVGMGLDRQAAAVAGGETVRNVNLGNGWWQRLESHHHMRLQAEQFLARFAPAQALRRLEAQDSSRSPTVLPPNWAAIDAELRARIAAMQADKRTAYSHYLQISSRFAASTDESARYLLICGQLALDHVRDLNQTADYLSQADSFQAEPDTSLQRNLLRCRLHAAQENREEARNTWEALWSQANDLNIPDLRIAVTIQGLILGQEPEKLERQLVADLSSVQHPSHRLLLLEGLRNFPGNLFDEIGKQIMGLLPPFDAQGQDPALAGLRLADVCRVCNRLDDARKTLKMALEAASGRWPLLRQIYQAHDRLGWSPELFTSVTDELVGFSGQENLDLVGLTSLEHAERVWATNSELATVSQLLQQAASLLNHPSSLWSARISALQARLALDHGNRREAEQLVDEASDAFSRMGQTRAAEEIGRILLEPNEEPQAKALSLEAATPDAAPIIRVSWRDLNGALTCTVEVSDDAGTVQTYETELSGSAVDLFRLDSSDPIATEFPAGFARDWLAVSREMGLLLIPPDLHNQTTGSIRLATDGRQSQWLPWELLRPEDHAPPLPLAWPQSLFYRHIPFARRVDLTEASMQQVLIVRMSDVQQRDVTRGTHLLLGTDIANLYRRVGVGVAELHEPSTDELLGTLDQLRPAVIHFIANIRQQGRQLYLDVGAGNTTYRGVTKGTAQRGSAGASPLRPGANQPATLDLTPTEMGSLISKVGLAPFVILDTPAPSSVTEWVRQLCLRNAFAGEWCQKEAPAGILATGMGYQEEQTRFYEILLDALPTGTSLGDLVQRIWQQGQDDPKLADVERYDPDNQLRRLQISRLRDTRDLPRYLIYASTALFTGDPTLMIPPLRS